LKQTHKGGVVRMQITGGVGRGGQGNKWGQRGAHKRKGEMESGWGSIVKDSKGKKTQF